MKQPNLMRRVYYEGRPNTDGQLYWFQDNRTGCEKQTVYFEKIRQLDYELITKEQKHLVNAMERLKQLRYPRRRPVVLNENCKTKITKYQQKSRIETHEDRKNRGRKSSQYLNAKPMEMKFDNKNDRANLRPNVESPYKTLAATSNAKSHTNDKNCFLTNFSDNKPDLTKSSNYTTCDLFFPSLPCIPNVGHKTNIEIENKLRILEIANGEFQTRRLSNFSSRSNKKKGKINLHGMSSKTDDLAPIHNDILTPETSSPTELKKCLKEAIVKIKHREIEPIETQSRSLTKKETAF